VTEVPPKVHALLITRRKRQATEFARARRAKGVSQPEAARLLDVPLHSVRAWEIARRTITPAALKYAARFWGADRALLGLDDGEVCPCCGRPA
jgi:DNA-binding transcriptional regulator YiaG